MQTGEAVQTQRRLKIWYGNNKPNYAADQERQLPRAATGIENKLDAIPMSD